MSALVSENQQWVDSSGPIAGGKIYIGDQGADPILNPKDIFSDRDLTVALANPVTLDSLGFPGTKIWLSGRYSLRIEDSLSNLIIETLDNGEDEGTVTNPLANLTGTNAITAEGTPTVNSLGDQDMYLAQIANTNTTDAVTMKIDATLAKSLTIAGGNNPGTGNLRANQTILFAYNLGQDRYDILSVIDRPIKDVVSKSATYTVAITERGETHVLSGASFTATLPTAASAAAGFEITFKYAGSEGTQAYTIDGNGAETIDGSADYTLDKDNQGVTLVCDGTNWKVKSSTNRTKTVLGSWLYTNLPTTAVDSIMSLGDGSAQVEMCMPRAGSIRSISVNNNAARTAGTATFEVTVNGVAVTLNAVLDGTNPQYVTASQVPGIDTFSALDRIGVNIQTASFEPIGTTDPVAIVEVEFDD